MINDSILASNIAIGSPFGAFDLTPQAKLAADGLQYLKLLP
jgi:hypothetical protein